jgi:hypothetical protein
MLSFVTVPAILDAPAPLAAKQWAKMYGIASKFAFGGMFLSVLATGYVAYHQDPASLPFKLNVAATVIVPSILPYTLAFMLSTNNKLFAKRDELASVSLEDHMVEKGVAHEETTHALIDKWALLNLVRASIVGIGAGLAIWAAVNKREVVGFREIGLATGANRMG